MIYSTLARKETEKDQRICTDFSILVLENAWYNQFSDPWVILAELIPGGRDENLSKWLESDCSAITSSWLSFVQASCITDAFGEHIDESLRERQW